MCQWTLHTDAADFLTNILYLFLLTGSFFFGGDHQRGAHKMISQIQGNTQLLYFYWFLCFQNFLKFYCRCRLDTQLLSNTTDVALFLGKKLNAPICIAMNKTTFLQYIAAKREIYLEGQKAKFRNSVVHIGLQHDFSIVYSDQVSGHNFCVDHKLKPKEPTLLSSAVTIWCVSWIPNLNRVEAGVCTTTVFVSQFPWLFWPDICSFSIALFIHTFWHLNSPAYFYIPNYYERFLDLLESLLFHILWMSHCTIIAQLTCCTAFSLQK